MKKSKGQGIRLVTVGLLAAMIFMSLLLAVLLPELKLPALYFLFTYGIVLIIIAYFDYIPGPNHRLAEMLKVDSAYVRHLEGERQTDRGMSTSTMILLALGIISFLIGILIVSIS
ncbi:MAG: hypothetical protein Q7J68_00850 [Thermoplasmata archaeon]|nr:hypothetical protein [Thermoplasmata archaeon]